MRVLAPIAGDLRKTLSLTTQSPHAVCMLIGPEDWTPTNPSVGLEIASGTSLTAGAQIHEIDGRTL